MYIAIAKVILQMNTKPPLNVYIAIIIIMFVSGRLEGVKDIVHISHALRSDECIIHGNGINLISGICLYTY